MMITLNMIYEKLKSDCRCEKNRSTLSDNPLQAPLLYTNGPLSLGCVYVADAAELKGEELDGMAVVCVGTPAFDYLRVSFDLIIVENTYDLKALFNRIQTIFLSLLYWDAQLKHISRDSMDMQKLLEESRRELDYSFVFLNNFLKPIAICADSSLDGVPDKVQSELVASVLQNDAVEDVSKAPNARRFVTAHNKRGLYYNIYYNSDYRGKLLALCDSCREITRADECLFENICRHAEKMYELFSSSSMRMPGYVMMQRVIHAVLSDNCQYGNAEVSEALKFARWGVNDSYVVCFIPFGENGSIPVRAEYIVTLLENRWSVAQGGYASGIVLEDGIAWIVNISLSAEGYFDEFLPEFIDLVRGFSFQAGMSATCHDFFSLRAYLKQAATAIRIGSRMEPGAVFYSFKKYALEHMLDSAVGTFNAEDVIHPSLITLMNYDREHNTEFCKTLRVFIKYSYNVLQASSELFIHRSTFSVRIKRIESLCRIDLDDERTRLHILLSFYIQEKLGCIRQQCGGDR
ncbi:carbohydrate diacid regulator [Oxobacter pfennigii]|uniref:Carbohydrate diacid regulator n=1 Tax=Oxobacter pfennigii TaxID=36849 RepID=A0A0P8W757_9CLOT|nr:helix-turn-helix domain-containing protein [Oxobacter pfennigii]KPU43629.1 carbohydrate diacid regulator [Oxobacter pfennigii]